MLILIPMFLSKSRKFQNSRTFIYTKQENLCIFLKEVYFLIIFVICLFLQAGYIRIKQEIPAFFYIPHCRTNFQKFSILFQGAKFFNSLSREIQSNESIRFFGKRLKYALEIYSVLSYILFLFSSLTFKDNPFFIQYSQLTWYTHIRCCIRTWLMANINE